MLAEFEWTIRAALVKATTDYASSGETVRPEDLRLVSVAAVEQRKVLTLKERRACPDEVLLVVPFGRPG